MTDSINCSYARAAARHFTSKYMTKGFLLPKGSYSKIMQEYNEHFSEVPELRVTYNTAAKRFTTITRRFNDRWHPAEARDTFLSTFSIWKWKQLPLNEKRDHTLRDCKACQNHSSELVNAFPGSRKTTKVPLIKFTKADLSKPAKFGRKALRELNVVTQTTFKKSIQDVLVETPKSQVIHKPTSVKRQSDKRKLLRQTSHQLKEIKEQESINMVLTNRISWRKFDKLNKMEGLVTPERKRQLPDAEEPAPKRKHGCSSKSLPLDSLAVERLLNEAKGWSPSEKVNWSQVACRYGLTSPNKGQIVKEFMEEQGIPAASISQTPTRAPRRSKKKVQGGRLSIPMHRPLPLQRQNLQKKIASGKVSIGEEAVKSTYTQYTLDPVNLTVVEKNKDVFARKIPFLCIREKLLRQHEELGLIRIHPDVYFENLQTTEIQARLQELGEPYTPDEATETLRAKLKSLNRQRFFKVWHDHSTIGGHSHLMILISPIYDPAFYYTPEEVERQKGIKVDVPNLVEKPEINILGRSTSSLGDQMLYSECRRQCLQDLHVVLKTTAGTPVVDVVRFFHGDGPAQQFEAGHKIGGKYSCVGCGALTSRFDDLAYCHHAPRQTFAERQEFVLQGQAWKQRGKNTQRCVKMGQFCHF